MPDEAAHAELLFGLARAQASILDEEEAWATLSRAFDDYLTLGDLQRAIEVAGYAMVPKIGRVNAGQLISRALEQVPPDSHQAGNLLAHHGLALSCESGNYDDAKWSLGQASLIAQKEGDTALEIRTLAIASGVHLHHLHLDEAAEAGTKAITLARKTKEPLEETGARFHLAASLEMMGGATAARTHATAMLSSAGRLHDRHWLANALRMNGSIYHLEGEWGVARSFYDQGLEISPLDPWLLSSRVVLDYEVGDLTGDSDFPDMLLEIIRQTKPGPTAELSLTAITIPKVSRITGGIDHLDVAQDAAETLLASQNPVPLYAMIARMGLAMIAVDRGDGRAAEEQYPHLQQLRGRVLSNICIDRLLGLICVASGQLDTAMEHFADAIAFSKTAGYRPELAWAYCDYAESLVQRDGTGDRANSASMLDEALTLATELGAGPLLHRVAGIRDRLNELLDAPTGYPSGLTEREVEVLRLVAAGSTDREIAEELVIGVRTVSTHVGNILNKTGANNRVEAANFANQHGLTTQISSDDS